MTLESYPTSVLRTVRKAYLVEIQDIDTLLAKRARYRSLARIASHDDDCELGDNHKDCPACAELARGH